MSRKDIVAISVKFGPKTRSFRIEPGGDAVIGRKFCVASPGFNIARISEKVFRIVGSDASRGIVTISFNQPLKFGLEVERGGVRTELDKFKRQRRSDRKNKKGEPVKSRPWYILKKGDVIHLAKVMEYYKQSDLVKAVGHQTFSVRIDDIEEDIFVDGEAPVGKSAAAGKSVPTTGIKHPTAGKGTPAGKGSAAGKSHVEGVAHGKSALTAGVKPPTAGKSSAAGKSRVEDTPTDDDKNASAGEGDSTDCDSDGSVDEDTEHYSEYSEDEDPYEKAVVKDGKAVVKDGKAVAKGKA